MYNILTATRFWPDLEMKWKKVNQVDHLKAKKKEKVFPSLGDTLD